ncbi:hypothetical protein NQ314_012318 [Rhamnusium bicolor]|uniref:Uncharacterized protein n=1 Tax=Rhamnusium bicolor TaxID=1586634 RepID=A0AAV8XC18_9CUCU|nr:hypothetical protein NQ314_012318 [Rhamnusium bicolor]
MNTKVLSRAGRTLHEVQTHLDREGASDLVVELVIKSGNSPSIFVEAVELGNRPFRRWEYCYTKKYVQ